MKMNNYIKPVVCFCVTAALWIIPSYYLREMDFGKVYFYIMGVFPSMFLQLCMFLPPIEHWVRYVPIPGILCFGILELIVFSISGSLDMLSIFMTVLFILPHLFGFLLGWVYYFYTERKK